MPLHAKNRSCAPRSRADAGSVSAVYLGLNQGRLNVARLDRTLAGAPLPRTRDGRLVLADVSPWLRPDADTSSDRSFCHTFDRCLAKHQMVPGYPYSIVAALETGRTSWTALLDAIRPDPVADLAAVTAEQGSVPSSNDSCQPVAGRRLGRLGRAGRRLRRSPHRAPSG
ncbi:transposase [Streptomyces sp. NPDC050256]|uniref:transposase n=1 Tax=Streptomyces sp. NPDC050256 TaxID=3365607 RepID=UPI0037BB203B